MMVVLYDGGPMKTPKALANSSPGLERSDNPGESNLKSDSTLKGFLVANPFRVQSFFPDTIPGFSLRSNPGLELANAFGVFQIVILSLHL
jgi:hypothetical protein